MKVPLSQNFRYMQGMKSNSKHLSPSADSATMRVAQTLPRPQPVQAEDWFGPEAIKSLGGGGVAGGGGKPTDAAVIDALWSLRDHMMKESSKLDNFLGHFN